MGKLLVFLLCIFLLNKVTKAENPTADLPAFVNFINDEFPVLYKIAVVDSLPILKATIDDMDILRNTIPDVTRKTTQFNNFIREVKSAKQPMKIDQQYYFLQKWQEELSKEDAPLIISLLFSFSLEKNGLTTVLNEFGTHYKHFYEEFNNKLDELWPNLSEEEKDENKAFTAWYNEYKKLNDDERKTKFALWGELFTIIANEM